MHYVFSTDYQTYLGQSSLCWPTHYLWRTRLKNVDILYNWILDVDWCKSAFILNNWIYYRKNNWILAHLCNSSNDCYWWDENKVQMQKNKMCFCSRHDILLICVKHPHSSFIFGSFSLLWVKFDKVNAILILSVWVSATQPDKFLQCLLSTQTGHFDDFRVIFLVLVVLCFWRWLLQLFFVLSGLKNVNIIIKSTFSEFVWISRG